MESLFSLGILMSGVNFGSNVLHKTKISVRFIAETRLVYCMIKSDRISMEIASVNESICPSFLGIFHHDLVGGSCRISCAWSQPKDMIVSDGRRAVCLLVRVPTSSSIFYKRISGKRIEVSVCQLHLSLNLL